MSLFGPNCLHDWEVKSKDILPSAYEQMIAGKQLTDSILPVWFQKKIVIILSCKECGKLDKTIETN